MDRISYNYISCTLVVACVFSNLCRHVGFNQTEVRCVHEGSVLTPLVFKIVYIGCLVYIELEMIHHMESL